MKALGFCVITLGVFIPFAATYFLALNHFEAVYVGAVCSGVGTYLGLDLIFNSE